MGGADAHARRSENVGQDDRIAGIRFGSAGPVPITVTGNGEWIDGVHRPTGGEQRGNHEQARALDRDGDRLIRAVATFSQHTNQLGETGGTDADPPFRPYSTRFIDNSDIVVIFGPIDPTRQTHVNPLSVSRIDSVDWAPAA